tara:strand:+ start:1240 stop:1803 length:564 start_codon:yes stop_codon:yes gene_type:complete
MYYSDEELISFGFKKIGKNLKVSRLANFYSIEDGEMGDNVRIDDYVILKGKIYIGSNVHISCFCHLSGGSGITLKDFSGISSHTSIFSAVEDFISPTLMSPSIDRKYSKIIDGPVVFEEGAKLGSHCIVLPGITVGKHSTATAQTLINKDVKDFAVIGPKVRGFKTFGFRDKKAINDIKSHYLDEKN